jgi:LCCL domain
MKIVHQLIDYFVQSGEISKAQLAQLEKKGFWAQTAPTNVGHLAGEIGASFFFLVTGATSGPVWGTDIYTSDSSLSVAAVHAGLLKSGEKRVLKVTIETPLYQYVGSLRNGINSGAWNHWPGAFSLSLLS